MFQRSRQNLLDNTRLKGVEVKNADVFAETFLGMGYEVEKVMKKSIPGKNLPTAHDPETGPLGTGTSRSTSMLTRKQSELHFISISLL